MVRFFNDTVIIDIIQFCLKKENTYSKYQVIHFSNSSIKFKRILKFNLNKFNLKNYKIKKIFK